MNPLQDYLDAVGSYKERLFRLYDSTGAVLGRKETPRGGGTTWGYRLVSCPGFDAGGKLTGTSIGDDEIRIFYDICQLIKPRRSMVIGNGFGLSAFGLALAWPEGEVVAMDNWSEGEAGIAGRDLSLKICREGGMDGRVTIFTGTSPQDTPAAMRRWVERGENCLDLAFIDGLHAEAAAAADFEGLRPYLRSRSVVIWHNIHKTARAFEEASAFWQAHCALRSYGPLGISYQPEEHPQLHSYLQVSNLVWNEWSRYLRALLKSRPAAPPADPSLAVKTRRRIRSVLKRIQKM
jgi:predicted O-methyltransferase YrrM